MEQGPVQQLQRVDANGVSVAYSSVGEDAGAAKLVVVRAALAAVHMPWAAVP